MRAAVTRWRVMAARLSPFLMPKAEPVSVGDANGSKPSLVQSSSISSKVALMSGRLEVLQVVKLGLAIDVVVAAGEQVHGAVVVDRADDAVEVDDAVEELPRDVALQRLEERVGRHDVLARRPLDVDEVLVPAELEFAEPEGPVAVLVRFGGLDLDGAVMLIEVLLTGDRVFDVSCEPIPVMGRSG